MFRSEIPVIASITDMLSASQGEIKTFVFGGGSKAILGAQSSTRVVMSSESCDITLMSGEAFFDVVSNSNRTFTVNAGAMEIEVTGIA